MPIVNPRIPKLDVIVNEAESMAYAIARNKISRLDALQRIIDPIALFHSNKSLVNVLIRSARAYGEIKTAEELEATLQSIPSATEDEVKSMKCLVHSVELLDESLILNTILLFTACSAISAIPHYPENADFQAQLKQLALALNERTHSRHFLHGVSSMLEEVRMAIAA